MLNDIDRRRSESDALVELRCHHTPHAHHRLGAKIGPDGLLFWCKDCRRAHLLSWRDLEEARRLVAFPARVR
jgi:hypothetical protein